MRIPALFAILIFAGGAHAAVLTWPGPTPCDGTLYSCVLSANSGDIVRITNNHVGESVSIINKSLTLEAAPGYLPRFAENERVLINMTDGGNHSVTVRGLLFARGQIQAYHDSGDGTVLIERNRFEASRNNEPSIWLAANSAVDGADFDYVVRYNHVYDSTAPSGALRLSAGSAGNGWIRGEFVGNFIRARGDNARAIAIHESQGSRHIARLHGNTVEGGGSRGISVSNGADGGSMSVSVYSNLLFDSPLANSPGRGITLESYGAEITGNVVNNTVIHRDYGLVFRVGTGGAMTATVANNLIAHNSRAWLITAEAAVSEHHNLFWNNLTGPGAIDATSITADPLLHPALPGRLRAGSPAIDAGDDVATSALPALDARGNRRYIDGSVDIGAVESGDQWLLARDPDGDNNSFLIDSPSLNGQPGLYPQLTPVWNPHGPGVGVYNDANEGLYYHSNHWRVFNQSLSDTILQDASFWIFNAGPNLQVGNHTNATANTTSTIDWSPSNLHPERILGVTQHWNRSGENEGVYNNHPIGIFYASGKWRIANLDGANIPAGADFNLFTQDPSQNAFEHIARGANRSGNWTFIRHPLLDGNPCARMQVTQSAGQGVFNAHPIGVFYNGSHWAIFNQDRTTMPENAAFHVIVDGDSFGCLTFSDRFQG